MINYYQTGWLKFLKLHPDLIPRKIKVLYYLSFEDAFLDLIRHKFPHKKHLTVLVPDFYCTNVLDNWKKHGLKYIYYPLDSGFQINSSAFKKYLWLYEPDIVIVFNACGIKSGLFSDFSWLQSFPKKSLLIEDGVHQLIHPPAVNLINNRHFFIDSLRKVSPFPGSRLIGDSSALDFCPPRNSFFSSYSLKSCLLFSSFRIIFRLGMVLGLGSLVSASHTRLLKKHDDIIGTHNLPHSGPKIFLPFINRLNYQRLYRLKSAQIKLYDRVLFRNCRFPTVSRLNIPATDFPFMHVYPLVFSHSPDQKLIDHLHRQGIIVWFKFTDCPWSMDRSVLFLPLGHHITASDIRYIADKISEYYFTNPNGIYHVNGFRQTGHFAGGALPLYINPQLTHFHSNSASAE